MVQEIFLSKINVQTPPAENDLYENNIIFTSRREGTQTRPYTQGPR